MRLWHLLLKVPAHLPALLQERYYAYSCLREKTLEVQEGSILPSMVQLVGQSRDRPLHRSTPLNHTVPRLVSESGTIGDGPRELPSSPIWRSHCSPCR